MSGSHDSDAVERVITQIVVTPLVVSAHECAAMIGMSYDAFRKLAAEQRWQEDELPNPTWIGRGSGVDPKTNRRYGRKVWRLVTIERWLEAHEWAAD